MVEAAGVELFNPLTRRNLLILHLAKKAKKPPLPIPLYVYCTKIPSRVIQCNRPSQPEYPTLHR
jgi:hypothetical protein